MLCRKSAGNCRQTECLTSARGANGTFLSHSLSRLSRLASDTPFCCSSSKHYVACKALHIIQFLIGALSAVLSDYEVVFVGQWPTMAHLCLIRCPICPITVSALGENISDCTPRLRRPLHQLSFYQTVQIPSRSSPRGTRYGLVLRITNASILPHPMNSLNLAHIHTHLPEPLIRQIILPKRYAKADRRGME